MIKTETPMSKPSIETIRYWMEKAIERPMHLSPPQAEEAAEALRECLAIANRVEEAVKTIKPERK